jgi:hypothetical protein
LIYAIVGPRWPGKEDRSWEKPISWEDASKNI